MPYCAGCKLCTENNWKLKLGTLCATQIEHLLASLKCHLFQFFELQAVYMTFYLQEQKIYMLPYLLTTHSIYSHGTVGQGILSHHSPSWHSLLLLFQTRLGRIPFLLLRIRGRKPQYPEEQNLQPTTSCSAACGGFMWIDNDEGRRRAQVRRIPLNISKCPYPQFFVILLNMTFQGAIMCFSQCWAQQKWNCGTRSSVTA